MMGYAGQTSLRDPERYLVRQNRRMGNFEFEKLSAKTSSSRQAKLVRLLWFAIAASWLQNNSDDIRVEVTREQPGLRCYPK